MPGQPAETMVGVGAVGFGALLLYAAVKNKNPVAVLRHVVTTGSLDLSGISGWDNPLNVSGIADAAIKSAIKVKLQQVSDAKLRDDVTAYLDNGTGDVGQLVQRLENAGWTDIADMLRGWANNHGANTPAPVPAGGGGGTPKAT